MALWFAGLAVVAVWAVLRDPRVDYRLVAVGALLPDVVDGVLGGPRLLHSLLFSAALLVAVVLVTVGRRDRRRRLLALPFGTFLHLVLDAVWTRPQVFWWPFLGSRVPPGRLPSLERPVAVVVAQEVAGAVALAWWWRRVSRAPRSLGT